jgi:hypothetical protein
MTWPDGDSYVGAWSGGKREGWGAYYWNNGNSYQVLTKTTYVRNTTTWVLGS